MKRLIFLSILLFVQSAIFAQLKPLKLEVNGSLAQPTGDFGSVGSNIENAGFAKIGSQADMTLKAYSKKGFGFGLRFGMSEFYRDPNAYAASLLDMVASDNSLQYRLDDSFLSLSTIQLGISYQLQITDRVFIEPYVFAGADNLTIEKEELDFLKDGTTHNFYRDDNFLMGFSVNPGINLGFVSKRGLGLYLYASYYKSFLEELESEYTVVSPSSIERTSETINISPEYFCFGIGISISVGKFKEKKE